MCGNRLLIMYSLVLRADLNEEPHDKRILILQACGRFVFGYILVEGITEDQNVHFTFIGPEAHRMLLNLLKEVMNVN